MAENNSSLLPLLQRVAQAIYDKKGFNILVLDVRGVCSMTDYFIIAEGTVDRHVMALASAIIDETAKVGQAPFRVEGGQTGDWLVLDYIDFIVHLFLPELREKYALEELWQAGKIVDITFENTPVLSREK